MPAPKVLDEMQSSLDEEITDILDKHDILSGKDKDKLQATLLSKLENMTKSGASPDEIMQGTIATIKRLTNMSDKEAKELARKLLSAAKEISLISKIQEQEKSLSFPTDTIPIKKKDFKNAMLKDIGDVFHGYPMSEEKRRLMESQLAEEYAKDLGISLEDREIETRPTDARTLDSDITTHVNDWVKKLPITINNDKENNEFENNKRDFISKLIKILPLGDYEKNYEETEKYMLNMPLDSEMKNDKKFLSRKAEELLDNLVSISSKPKKRRYGMSFNGLTDFIDSWLDNIHIHDKTKDEEEIKDMKKDMAYSLVHKIGEMNIDPEIFNDDSLYEEVLRDELQNLLGDITITDENFQALKEDLIAKVKEAHLRAHHEITGQTYKHNLRDTIINILPDQRNLSKDEQASMEILKDQLADAFINLHYSGNNENLRAQLKRKISDEINTFCKNYLQKHPEEPMNSQKLNYELYTALNKVPLPTGDAIRYEVEQARIREEINDWLKELPLQPQKPAELLARNKLVYVLSKKLFDIEVEADDTEDIPLMRKEIVKFLNKMPLKPGQDNISLADKLIDKLRATEVSRKFSASSNVTIDAFGNVSARTGVEGPVCPYYKSLLDKKRAPGAQPCHRKPKSFPPCTLNPEDMDHLERIRRRTCLSPKCVTSLLKYNKRNTGAGPRSIDAGSQTELRSEAFGIDKPQQSPVCPAANEKTPRPCPGVPSVSLSRPSGNQTRRPTISSSHIQTDNRGEVQPHIIVKEYYWDTANNSNFQESEFQQPGKVPYYQAGTSPYQPRPAPCPTGTSPCTQIGPTPSPPIGTSPYQKTGLAPYHQTETSPYHQSGPAPCHRPNFAYHQEPSTIPQQPSPTHQQENTSPQKGPCDFFTPPQSQRDRYPRWSQRSFPIPQDRSSPSPRSPSPCMRPLTSPFGPTQHSTPLSSPGFSSRHNDCRMPKRDGLQDQIHCTSSRPSKKERVIELGSLDDLCHPRPKKRNSNNFDWSYAKFPEDDSFWGTPCMRRVILDEGIDEPLMMEREQREERVRCKCKEKLVPKFARTHSRTCHRQTFPPCNEDGHNLNNLNRCSKCCGLHCPYPSCLYFNE